MRLTSKEKGVGPHPGHALIYVYTATQACYLDCGDSTDKLTSASVLDDWDDVISRRNDADWLEMPCMRNRSEGYPNFSERSSPFRTRANTRAISGMDRADNGWLDSNEWWNGLILVVSVWIFSRLC